MKDSGNTYYGLHCKISRLRFKVGGCHGYKRKPETFHMSKPLRYATDTLSVSGFECTFSDSAVPLMRCQRRISLNALRWNGEALALQWIERRQYELIETGYIRWLLWLPKKAPHASVPLHHMEHHSPWFYRVSHILVS